MVETWVIYAFAGFFCYFIVNLLFKFVAKESSVVVGLIFYLTAAAFMLAISVKTGSFSISTKTAVIAVVIGLFSATGFVFALKSIRLSPNPSYSVAIYSANFVLLAIVSVFVFKSTLTMQKIVGILAVLAGLVLLSI